jgi:hypothetical protein
MNKSLWVVLLVLAMALPASAAEPLITDPCGDLMAHGHVQGEPVSTPGDQTSAFDIATADITSVAGGVDLRIDVCGAATTPEHNQSYAVGWVVGANCKASVTLSRGVRGNVGDDDIEMDNDPRATFEQTCTEPAKDGELFGSGTTIFRLELPDTTWRVDGSTVALQLRAAELPAPAAALLDPGTVWLTPYAVGRYLPASGVGSLFFNDAQGAASVRASDGADHAGTAESFVVGS